MSNADLLPIHQAEDHAGHRVGPPPERGCEKVSASPPTVKWYHEYALIPSERGSILAQAATLRLAAS